VRAAGFADPRLGTRLAVGFGIGGVLVTLITIIPVLAGHERIAAGGGGAALVTAGATQLGMLAPQSAAEEIVLRGFVLTQLRRGIGTIAAVVVTGSIFGVLHLGNPNASWWAAGNIALAGIWLGALVVRSGSLWLTIGLHIAWNWFEGFVWGQPVSGLSTGQALVERTYADGALWTGGAFGPEASAVTAIVLVVFLAGTLLLRTKPA
jgi:membrane protease YdiL (CAAX protease family)